MTTHSPAPAPTRTRRASRASRASRGRAAGTDATPDGARLWIDWTACDGRGWCADLLPELLTRDPEGYPLAHGLAGPQTREIAVPGGLTGHARRAVDACPRLALRLLAERPVTRPRDRV